MMTKVMMGWWQTTKALPTTIFLPIQKQHSRTLVSDWLLLSPPNPTAPPPHHANIIFRCRAGCARAPVSALQIASVAGGWPGAHFIILLSQYPPPTSNFLGLSCRNNSSATMSRVRQLIWQILLPNDNDYLICLRLYCSDAPFYVRERNRCLYLQKFS